MCFVLTLATPTFGIVACDTQHTYTPDDGSAVIPLDWGGKLLKVSGGWISGCGHGERMMRAGQALADVDFRDVSAVRLALARSHASTRAAIDRQFPASAGRWAHVFGVREAGSGFSVEIVRSDGEPHACGSGYYMNWPPPMSGSDPEAVRLSDALRREYSRERALPLSVLRRIAEIAAYCRTGTETMSDTLEIGLSGTLAGYLRAPIEDVLSSSATELRDRIRSNDGAETAERMRQAWHSFEAWKLRNRKAA